ncbi:pyrimidine-nucleoside phosphorylase [Enterococcus haemoperoxidus ATCC BAA-382]|uniref:Pyrimidine-nucleoside phosphorylase n=1 Tax=Enterococcus haemoperoxidus ATCC BAA-382 TaxID=1158608 RepID=R2TGZ7_9ENTE|nr:pyrimidine-nucleoside phosphorylase [Enterococcus haemoperoxidus]EOH99429.1 pyrimidine-nucleoside phosphorylase [Enterococcus haemoperoxidus ATCC BAA-382]EOT62830.1 pyrimidine-nucleoside phosphorylase [Enterococcus haemoperoxidus ATCC BAA-382]
MRMVDVIEKKRNGLELTKEEIKFFIDGYTAGTIPDYQASALLMAIYFQDMTDEERANLTLAMVDSGDVIDLSGIEGVKVDKHSTGGVGDTTTLVLAPLIAALDIPFAKMSGRGLGHTGGTLDKLESFDGFHIEISDEEFINIVNQDKIAVIGQSGNLTPADKKIYALRDVTGTVSSIPLIAGSIMSKKIAAGADAIVLDVKTGAGAFMKTEEDAEKLAEAMVRIGNLVGRKTMAIISDMSQPLGAAIGNSLEIKEAIDTLKGNGPEDLTELVLTLGSQMVVLAGKTDSLDEARKMLLGVIEDGSALDKFAVFVKNQGGNPEWVKNPELLPAAQYTFEVTADKEGVVSEIVADAIGVAAMKLGAGRATKEDEIDLAVGLVLNKKIGDDVKVGDSLVTIHANKKDVAEVEAMIKENIQIGDTGIAPKLIYKQIS